MPTKFLKIASTIERFGNLKVMTIKEAIWWLKGAHEKILQGQSESSGGQLLLAGKSEREAKKKKENFC